MSVDNYVCTLDTASIKKAKDELNEVPEDRLAAVQAFREWIVAQPHIRCPNTDTYFLLRFLRWSKFSQVRARVKLEHYLNQRVTLPKVFPDLDPTADAFIEITNTGYLFPLPKKDSQGRIIVMHTLEPLGKLLKKYSIPTLQRCFFILSEYVQRSEGTQVNGVVLFIDFTGFSGSVVPKVLTPETSNINKTWIESNPGRFKEIHHYRCGLLFDVLLVFVKHFLPKKLMDRIKTPETMESVYKYISKELLPREYLPDDYTGPSVGYTKDILVNYLAAVAKKEIREDMMYKSSAAFGVDESKIPSETVTQHFRKLNVD